MCPLPPLVGWHSHLACISSCFRHIKSRNDHHNHQWEETKHATHEDNGTGKSQVQLIDHRVHHTEETPRQVNTKCAVHKASWSGAMVVLATVSREAQITTKPIGIFSKSFWTMRPAWLAFSTSSGPAFGLLLKSSLARILAFPLANPQRRLLTKNFK